MEKKSCCLLAAVLFIATHSMSQTTNKSVADQLKFLLQWKGDWEAKNANLKSNGKDNKFAYYASFKNTADNSGFVMNEKASVPGIGKLNGTNLAGVSPYDGKVHWFSVDNLGTAHEHVGEFTDDKHFSMLYKGLQDGKEYVEKVSIEMTGPDTMNLREESTLDGKELLLVTGTFHRKKSG